MNKKLIHEFKVDSYNFIVKLEKETDDNYVINTYDRFNNYIEIYSRDFVKYKKEPTLEEFKDFWYDSITTGRF